MTIGVIGGGAWGTALAQVIASGPEDVSLWVREREVVDSINLNRENSQFLPGIRLDDRIVATTTLSDLARCDVNLLVVPAQFVRHVLAELPDQGQHLILCTKGIEQSSGAFMHDVAAEGRDPRKIAILSGPTFAHEVAAGKPTAVTLACTDAETSAKMANRIARPHFRPYISTDVIGTEIGGAVKNVLAIACGVVEGCGLGENARAALIARGFAEMTRFGVAHGALPETLAGLSGLGDLVLTCSSKQSRNFALGVGLGQGRSAADLLSHRLTVAEGASTAPILHAIAQQKLVEMPIVAAVCSLLSGEANATDAVSALLARPLKAEAFGSS